MKKILFSFVLLLITFQFSKAQAAKSIYFELGGPGLASFNYDIRFGAKEAGLGGRIGIGGLSIDGAGVILYRSD